MGIGQNSEYWIEGFRIDPDGLRISGPSGHVSLEPKIMQVLTLLAEQPGETVRRETFMDRIWAVEHGSDESLTRAISILRKSFRNGHRRRTIIETVPRKGYRLVANVSTTPPMVTQTPSVSAPRPEPRHEKLSLRARSGRYWTPITAGLVLIVGVASALSLQSPQGPADRIDVSRHLVQVLPFQSIDSGNDTEAVTASVTSQMASTLAAQGIPTSFERRNSTVIPEFEVDGDIWTQTDRLRATVRLKDHVTGQVIWSETADETDNPATDFGLGLSIKTASILDCLMTWRRGDYRSTPETLQHYARFCEAHEMRNTKDYSALTEPIYEAEPDNPMALTLHGWAVRFNTVNYRHMPEAEEAEILDEAEQLFSKALAINPDLPVAKVYHTLVTQSEPDLAAIDAVLADAAARNGLPETVYSEYASLLRQTGRLREAIWVYRRMAEFDATNPLTLARLGWMYAVEGDFRQSERYFAQAEAIDPDSVELLTRLRQVDLWLKDEDTLRQLLTDWPINETVDSTQYENCVKTYIRQVLNEEDDPETLKVACTDVEVMWTSRMFTNLGDLDNAYAMIADYDWSVYPDSTIYMFYPDTRPFREDARFWTLMERLGFMEFWTETGHWPDFCRTENHPDRCPAQS